MAPLPPLPKLPNIKIGGPAPIQRAPTGLTKAHVQPKPKEGRPVRVSVVDFDQDTFIIEVGRLVASVGPSNVGTKKQKEDLRSHIQSLLSDYMETVLNKKTAKTSTGAAADLQMTPRQVERAFGVTGVIKEAMRGIEIKSALDSPVGVTITQVGVGSVAGEKRRYEADFDKEGGISNLDWMSGQEGLGEFDPADQQKVTEITKFFREPPEGVGRLEGKQILAQARGSRSTATRPTGIFLIPFKPDGTVDMQNISSQSIANFVKNGKGVFAQKVRQQINEKMEEGLSFNLNFDTLRSGTRPPVSYAPKAALDLATDYNYEIDIRSKPRKGGIRTAFAIRPSLNAAGESKFEKTILRMKDSPQVVMKGFMDYAKKRLEAQYRGAKNDITKQKALLNFIGFFAQFEPGTLTPYQAIGTLQVPAAKSLIVRGAGSIRNKAKVKRAKGERSRGDFMSNVQLSAILQKRLAKKMPKLSEPQRPTPRYVTGRLARSFQIMANYRQGLIGFFNTPPAAGYVDELNENGWLLDETLVQPTIREITQQLFGRQFRVLRTQ